MTVEVLPNGVACNLQCTFCYQHSMRDAGHIAEGRWDFEAVKNTIARKKNSGAPTLFGGEALLLPLPQLEEFFLWTKQEYGHAGMQTNASLFTEAHHEMVNRVGVYVGVSLDGPGELNDARWAGSLAKTREATAKSEAALERLIKDGRTSGVITTLCRTNATEDKLPGLKQWFRHLDGLGLRSARLHIMESDNEFVRQNYELTTEENLRAFLEFQDLESELSTLRFDIFKDIRQLLMGNDGNASCVWVGCDPLNTRAVQGVGPTGTEHNCGRTTLAGINWEKAEGHGYERQIALYHTPQEHGGCQGCRFFLMCRGQCPGTAIGRDWRNKSQYCETWKGLFAHAEQTLVEEGRQPVSLSANRNELERNLISGWERGDLLTMSHGDYTDHGDSS